MIGSNAYADIIGKYLAGEASPAEEAELMAWVEQSPANKQFFEEIRQVWRLSAGYQPQPEIDKARAWMRIEDRLPEYAAPKQDAGSTAPESYRLRPLRIPLLVRIAAVLLPAVIALWWWQKRPPPASTIMAVQTTAGERREITLPDGSTVQLNQISELTFSENDSARYVTLSGEAFFEVKHQAGKPFVILSGEARTTVLGTSFNVRAYPGEAQVEVSVASGKVQVEAVEAPEQMAVLQAGQAVALQKQSRRLAPAESLTANAAAWKDRRLNFRDTRMSEVALAIERYFYVSIQFDDPGIAACRFSGDYEDPKLEDVLNALTFAMDLQLEGKDAVFILQGEGCPR